MNLRARLAEQFRGSGVPRRLADVTVRGFVDLAGNDPEKKRALAAVVDRAEFNTDRSLLLYGPNGTGKTGLTVALYNRLEAASRHSTLFITYGELLAAVRAGYSDNTAYGRITVLRNVGVLVIDDLADPFSTRSASDNARSILFDVLGHRYDRRATTLMTANIQDTGELADLLDPRLADRITDMADCVYLGGRNLRRQ